MKLFQKTPADEAQNIRRKLAETRAGLTAAQTAEITARDAFRRAVAQGEAPAAAEAALAEAREEASRATAAEAELTAALEEAEARAAAAAREASLEGLRAQARDAAKDGEKAAAEAVKTLRQFVLAWGRIEAARELIDRCDRLARRKYDGADLGVVAALPGRYQLVPLATDDLPRAGTMVRTELEGIGFYLPPAE